MKRSLAVLFVALIVVSVTAYRFAMATEPLDSTRPQDFVKGEILEPQHGAVLREGDTTLRVRVTPLSGYNGPLNLKVTVRHLGHDDATHLVDRQGKPAREPFYLLDGESVVDIPIKLAGTGIYSLEAETGNFQPFSNRAEVKIGVNPYLHK